MEITQAFMVYERQNRIFRNKQKMNGIMVEFEQTREKYKGVVSKIKELEAEYLRIEKQLSNLEQSYVIYKDEDFLHIRSECIQNLSEKIEFKEEQIQFTKCLNKAIKKNKKSPMFLKGLYYFYKYKDDVEKEENQEKASFIKVTRSYLKQYKFLKKLGVKPTATNINKLISVYETQKQNMIINSNKIEDQLDQRRKCIRKYPDNKELLQKRLLEISKLIEKLNSLFDHKTYQQKISAYERLKKENEIYQAQINGLMALSNTQEDSQVELQEESQNGKIIKFKVCA